MGYSQTITTIKPDASEGKDATISSFGPNKNYGERESITAYTWTGGGSTVLDRFLIEFDLSSIPENAIIEKVELSLFYNPTDQYEGFDFHEGDNDMTIRKISSGWEEDNVTWGNQPSATIDEQITLPPSASNSSDYLDIDVTDLYTNTDNTLSDNFGLMFKMDDEVNPYKSLIFSSCEHPDNSLHPELKITWDIESSNENLSINNQNDIKIYPNPTSSAFNLTIANINGRDYELKIYNMVGCLIYQQIDNKETTNLDLNLAYGVYYVEVNSGDNRISKRLIIQK